MESRINILINFIRLDYALIQKTIKENSDLCLNFILLMTKYDVPLSDIFKKILRNIHLGKMPEEEIDKIITPSKDFNEYLSALKIFKYKDTKLLNKIEEQSLEKTFKIFLRQLQNKISIIFFFGIFYPIGLCFIILLQRILIIYLLITIPIFFLFLQYLYKKFIKIDINLIGLLTEQSILERKKFNEFIKFIKKFAVNLKENISQEKAFIDTYLQNRDYFQLLRIPIRTQITNLIKNSVSFNEMMDLLNLSLKSIRYKLIIESIKRFVNENAYYSSEKLLEIIKLIQIHKKLENKLLIIIKGEKFKVFFYLILLPIIIGAFGGIFPFFGIFNFDMNLKILSISEIILNSFNLLSIILIFILLLSSTLITSYFFLKIINYQNKIILIFLCLLLYIFFFFISAILILNIFNF